MSQEYDEDIRAISASALFLEDIGEQRSIFGDRSDNGVSGKKKAGEVHRCSSQ